MATTSNTHVDPSKVFGEFLKTRCEGNQPTLADLIAAVMAVQDQIAGQDDLDGFQDLLASLNEICDKLLALPDYTSQFETLTTNLQATVTELQALCTKIETTNNLLLTGLEANTAAVNNVKACIDALAAQLAEDIAKLVTAQIATTNAVNNTTSAVENNTAAVENVTTAVEEVNDAIQTLTQTNTVQNEEICRKLEELQVAIAELTTLMTASYQTMIGLLEQGNVNTQAILAALENDLDATKLVYKLEGQNGIVAKRWAGDDAAKHGPTDTMFDCGEHVNGAPSETSILQGGALLDNNTNFPVTGDDLGTSQELYETYVYFPQAVTLVDNNTNTGEWLAVKAASCTGKPVLLASTPEETGGANPGGLGTIGTVGPGIVRLQMEISDFSAFGGFFIRESVDGGITSTVIPPERFYTSMPSCVCSCVIVKDGELTNFNDGSPFVFDPINCLWCKPDCTPTPEGAGADQVSRFLADGCDDVDGDPANYIPVTRVTTYTNGDKTVAYFTGFGTAAEAEVTPSLFVDCASGVPIVEEPPIEPTCSSWATGQAYGPRGENGVTVERWNGADAVQPGQVPALQAFNTEILDANGLPTHVNPSTSVTVQQGFTILDNVVDQSQLKYCTYFYTTEVVTIEDNLGRAEAVQYYAAQCCGELIPYATGDYPNFTPAGRITLQPGIHKLAGLVHDLSAYSGVAFRIVNDDGSYSPIPDDQLFVAKPETGPCQVKICLETGVCADIKTGALLSNLTLCEPNLCVPAGGVVAPAEDPIAINPVCILEPKVVNVTYNVTAFDPNTVEINGEGTCRFSVNAAGLGEEISITPMVGVDMQQVSATTFDGVFFYDGLNEPNQPLVATITLADGCVGVLEDPDFFMCSGNTATVPVTFKCKATAKELCYAGDTPSLFKKSDGTVLDAATIEICPEAEDKVDCAPKTLYKLEGELGATVQTWIPPEALNGGGSNATVNDVFTDTDAFGYPLHPNAPSSVAISPVASTGNVPSAGGERDQAQADFWLCIPKSVQLREFGGSAETVQVWGARECGEEQMSLIADAPYPNTTPVPIGTWGPGLFRFRLYMHDFSANGIATLQYLDGTVWRAIPPSWVFQNKPTVKCIDGWRCCDGKYYNAGKTEIFEPVSLDDITGDKRNAVYANPPGCPGDSPC